MTEGALRLRTLVEQESQVAVADKAGVSQQAISTWLTGFVRPDVPSIERLRLKLGIEPGLWFTLADRVSGASLKKGAPRKRAKVG